MYHSYCAWKATESILAFLEKKISSRKYDDFSPLPEEKEDKREVQRFISPVNDPTTVRSFMIRSQY
jgi:hypothetical protein